MNIVSKIVKKKITECFFYYILLLSLRCTSGWIRTITLRAPSTHALSITPPRLRILNKAAATAFFCLKLRYKYNKKSPFSFLNLLTFFMLKYLFCFISATYIIKHKFSIDLFNNGIILA